MALSLMIYPLHLSHGKLSAHAIYFGKEKIKLPLLMDGAISYLPKRFPTGQDIQNCIHLELTRMKDWMPHSDDFTLNELAANHDSVLLLRIHKYMLSNPVTLLRISHACLLLNWRMWTSPMLISPPQHLVLAQVSLTKKLLYVFFILAWKLPSARLLQPRNLLLKILFDWLVEDT